jgi:uncharacterized membrane protein
VSTLIGTSEAVVVTKGGVAGIGPQAAAPVAPSWIAVGYSSTTGLEVATRWDGTTATTLTSPNGYAKCRAYAINSSGLIGGYAYDYAGTGHQYACTWSNGVPQLLEFLPGTTSPNSVAQVTAVSDAGHVVGWCYGADGNVRAVSWTGTTPTQLSTLVSQANGVNSAGVIAGWTFDAVNFDFRHATRWEGGVATVLTGLVAGDDFSEVLGINEFGQCVGESANASNFDQACTWASGSLTPVGLAPGGTTIATGNAINSPGVVVGLLDDTGPFQPTVWVGGTQTHLYAPGLGAGNAYAVDGYGTIAGETNVDGAVVWHQGTYSVLDDPNGLTAAIAYGLAPIPY